MHHASKTFLDTASCSDLCWAWCSATSPSKLRTAAEHGSCRIEAKRLRDAIERRFTYGIDYIESDSTGRLIAAS